MTRRPDPLGRRALFGPVAKGEEGQPGPAETRGRRAWFSAPESGRGRRVVVECGSCQARTPLDLVGVTRRLFPSVWVPTRRLSRLMCCPNCRRLTWCRLDWWGLLGA